MLEQPKPKNGPDHTRHVDDHDGRSSPPLLGSRSGDRPSSPGEELTWKNIEATLRTESEMREKRGWGERVAENVARFCGSMTFVWVHLFWFVTWCALNLALPQKRRWDPPPFHILALTVAMGAVLLSTFILISGNREALVASRREQLDLQINLLAEQENTRMLRLLEEIAARVGVQPQVNTDIPALREATRPEKVLEQIDHQMAKEQESPVR